MNEVFTIGGFCFRIICPDEVVPPANFMKFRGGSHPVYTYTITLSDHLPEPEAAPTVSREDFQVFSRGDREQRYIGMPGNPQFHACYVEVSETAAQICLRPERLPLLRLDPAFCALLALERRMLTLDGLILHCAFVEYQGEAILFSAPSETGKTTQANLWERHRGAETVNGDRGLLQKMNGRWYARGWPVCGSSGVCRNKDVPIRAIVMLSQAPEDRAERLGARKAFTQVYSQTTINRWDRLANLRALELLENLVTEVPVYHLACTMNETAVEALEAALADR